ncbi:hypothetical protein L6452_32255 [Arctium lappa]|uniref:Uncharacterized protein n=1 Tax=Arctium lappa TaxID=4217 RepID=A0ACB8Z5C2_ARCLA|nr:hypothetical protein L6452_32255 [Arctium lappa]
MKKKTKVYHCCIKREKVCSGNQNPNFKNRSSVRPKNRSLNRSWIQVIRGVLRVEVALVEGSPWNLVIGGLIFVQIYGKGLRTRS